jgi:hypothetical protein
VKVQVHDGLAGRFSHIDADVITVWTDGALQAMFQAAEQFVHRRKFLSGQVEEAVNVAAQNHERVPGRYREPIVNDKGVRITLDDSVFGNMTKRAVFRG